MTLGLPQSACTLIKQALFKKKIIQNLGQWHKSGTLNKPKRPSPHNLHLLMSVGYQTVKTLDCKSFVTDYEFDYFNVIVHLFLFKKSGYCVY